MIKHYLISSSRFICSFTSTNSRHREFPSKSFPIPKYGRLLLCLGCILLGGTASLQAQTNTKIENFDSINADGMSKGLGFNVNRGNAWEFQKAKKVGATEVRMQFVWEETENMSGVLALSSAANAGLTNAVNYGLEPIIIACYGPPRATVGSLTVTTAVPVGAYAIPVSGSILNSIDFPRCHVLKSSGGHIVAAGKWAYYGALIASVNTANSTITLAAKTNVAISSGTVPNVKLVLYPSVATSLSTDPSLVAYARYAKFLATQINARGLTGRVELWNEPGWAHDPWDARGKFYDVVPAGILNVTPNWGMLRAQFSNTPIGNVRYNWAGSHKSGSRCLTNMPTPLATASQVAASVSSSSYHPYKDSPEWKYWDPVKQRIGSWVPLEGTDPGSNGYVLRKTQLEKAATYGWQTSINITEAGCDTSNQNVKARYNLRNFLVSLSLGFERITYYKLADSGNYSWMNPSTQAPYQCYTAFKNLMTKINTMSTPPLAYTTSDLPSVASYSGYYPLSTIPIVGRTSSSATKNQIIFVAFQRSYKGSVPWKDMTSPAPVNITVQLPAGYTVARVWNLVTEANVSFATGTSTVTHAVTDGPIAVELVPSVNATIVFSQGSISAYGTLQDGQGGLPTSATVGGGGSSVTLAGNTWKIHPFAYTATAQTVMEFTIHGADTGEIT